MRTRGNDGPNDGDHDRTFPNGLHHHVAADRRHTAAPDKACKRGQRRHNNRAHPRGVDEAKGAEQQRQNDRDRNLLADPLSSRPDRAKDVGDHPEARRVASARRQERRIRLAATDVLIKRRVRRVLQRVLRQRRVVILDAETLYHENPIGKASAYRRGWSF